MPDSSRGGSARLIMENLQVTRNCKPFSITLAAGRSLCLLDLDATTTSLICDIIGGYAKPEKGQIFLDGRDLMTLPPAQRPIGMITARDPVFDHLSVTDHILLPLRARALPPQEQANILSHTLALVGLNDCERRRADTLNPEQKIRLRIGQVLAYAPSVLVIENIFDRSTVLALKRLRQLLTNLQRALQLTVVYATHDREDALWLGDKIALFSHQELLQLGDAASLSDHPACASVASLFSEANLLRGHVLQVEDDIARIHLACGGIAEAVAAPGLVENSLCTLSIRPDRIALMPMIESPSIETDEPPLIAKSQTVLHEVSRLRLKMRTADGTELELYRSPQNHSRTLAPGTTVQLAWQASQAVAFPLEDAL